MNDRSPHPEIVVATRNPAKIEEIRSIVADALRVLSLDDVDFSDEIQETGETFVENAILKATAVADATGLLTIADDSGLTVDALGGRPGIMSARYGGEGLSDADRIAVLLDELSDVPPAARGAEFVCTIALAAPRHVLATWSGRVYGLITDAPRGSGGFGYDPVFLYLPARKTFAEMTRQEKNAVSHRGRAVRQLPARLRDVGLRL